MRRVGAWGVAAALVAGLGVAAAAADVPDGGAGQEPPKGGWWSGWFGDKPRPKAEFRADKKPADDRPAPPRAAESAVFEQQKQMKAYMRRTEVCMRLRQIADQTGNADLLRQADELDARAWEVYRQQTARLPVPTPSLEDEGKGDPKGSARRPSAGPAGKGSAAKADDVGLPPVKSEPRRTSGADRLGGDFDRRERDLINGTYMGRDRP